MDDIAVLGMVVVEWRKLRDDDGAGDGDGDDGNNDDDNDCKNNKCGGDGMKMNEWPAIINDENKISINGKLRTNDNNNNDDDDDDDDNDDDEDDDNDTFVRVITNHIILSKIVCVLLMNGTGTSSDDNLILDYHEILVCD